MWKMNFIGMSSLAGFILPAYHHSTRISSRHCGGHNKKRHHKSKQTTAIRHCEERSNPAYPVSGLLCFVPRNSPQ
jgi:hypothetical protein